VPMMAWVDPFPRKGSPQKKARLSGDAPAASVENDPEWTDDDRKILATAVQSLWDARTRTPFGRAGCAEVASLLCCPRDELRERALSLLGNVNMVAALIFSGIVGNALAPMERPEGEEDSWKGTGVDCVNILVGVTTIMSLCMTCFSTYLILEVSVEPTTSGLYRAVARMTHYVGLIIYMTGLLNSLLCATVTLTIFLYIVGVSRWIMVGCAILIFVVMVAPFMETLARSFPSCNMTWSTLWYPPGLRQSMQTMARRSGAAKCKEAAALHGYSVFPFLRHSQRASEASDGGGRPSGGGDEGEGGASPEREPSEEEVELTEVLSGALPNAAHEHISHVRAAVSGHVSFMLGFSEIDTLVSYRNPKARAEARVSGWTSQKLGF